MARGNRAGFPGGWLALAGGVIALDQATKLWAARVLTLHQPEPLAPLINLTLMHNRGAAFSFLSAASGWQRWFFLALALAVSAFIVHWLWHLAPGQRLTAAALSLILGGALGNALDRLVHGYVIDFIDVYYGSWHWPAFNVADSAITVGAVLLVVEMLRGRA